MRLSVHGRGGGLAGRQVRHHPRVGAVSEQHAQHIQCRVEGARDTQVQRHAPLQLRALCVSIPAQMVSSCAAGSKSGLSRRKLGDLGPKRPFIAHPKPALAEPKAGTTKSSPTALVGAYHVGWGGFSWFAGGSLGEPVYYPRGAPGPSFSRGALRSSGGCWIWRWLGGVRSGTGAFQTALIRFSSP